VAFLFEEATMNDPHEDKARQVFDLGKGEAVSPEQRRLAKTINFGVMYGAHYASGPRFTVDNSHIFHLADKDPSNVDPIDHLKNLEYSMTIKLKKSDWRMRKFLKDWYDSRPLNEPRKVRNRAMTVALIGVGAFLLLSGICIAFGIQDVPKAAPLAPRKVTYEMYDDETMIQTDGDSARIGPYWEF
jgi:hypothetical protein